MSQYSRCIFVGPSASNELFLGNWPSTQPVDRAKGTSSGGRMTRERTETECDENQDAQIDDGVYNNEKVQANL
jgi:hypothetical protein